MVVLDGYIVVPPVDGWSFQQMRYVVPQEKEMVCRSITKEGGRSGRGKVVVSAKRGKWSSQCIRVGRNHGSSKWGSLIVPVMGFVDCSNHGIR